MVAKATAAGAGLLLLVVLLAGAAGAGASSLLSGGGSGREPSHVALGSVPPSYLALYEQAAATCPGLPWTVLAGIGAVESDHGRSTAPGVRTGANSAGAQGPMQFLPATFTGYDHPVATDPAPTPAGGASPPSPYDPVDAIYAAARDLCASGARDSRDIPGAIYAYNHADWYVRQVLAQAAAYAAPAVGTPGKAAAVAVAYAQAQLGTPYRWGGDTPGSGFDCSGLVQAAYTAAGIRLPRTAQQQYDAGAHLPVGAPLEPGDLVFFGTPDNVQHVGIVAADNQMIDAPHTGAVVRVESYHWTDYLGATRPTAPR